MTGLTLLKLSDLNARRDTGFLVEPDADARAAMAARLSLLGLRKLRFSGHVHAEGPQAWRLTGSLGATVVQPCVVTLDPVTTRIDEAVSRLFLPQSDLPAPDPEAEEVEMPEDDSVEALGSGIDLMAVMEEALALALPAYPRAKGAELGAATFADEGVKPLQDEDLKPFAGLKGLRDKLSGQDGDPND